MKLSLNVEALNHCECVGYILDHVMEPLTQRYLEFQDLLQVV